MAYRNYNSYLNKGAYNTGMKAGSFILGLAGAIKYNNDIKAENRIETKFTCAHCGAELKPGTMSCPKGCTNSSGSRHDADRSKGRR